MYDLNTHYWTLFPGERQAKSCNRVILVNTVTGMPSSKINKINVAIIALFVVIILLAAYGFRLHSQHAIRASIETKASPEFASPSVAKPTSTPLPPHFPETEAGDLEHAAHVADEIPIEKALETCWRKSRKTNVEAGSESEPESDPESETQSDSPATPAALTLEEIARLFGPLKKQEVLETTESGRKLGLLLEPQVFKSGAAGTVFEQNATADEPAKLVDLQLRADGQILHCHNALQCRCL